MVIRTVNWYSFFLYQNPRYLISIQCDLRCHLLLCFIFLSTIIVLLVFISYILWEFQSIVKAKFYYPITFLCHHNQKFVQFLSNRYIFYLNLIDFAVNGWGLSINPCSCLVDSWISIFNCLFFILKICIVLVS